MNWPDIIIIVMKIFLITRPAHSIIKAIRLDTNVCIMNSMKNNVQLIGYLGKDVELLEFEKGNKLAKVTMATNEQYTNNQGEKVEDTQWHNLVCFGKTAEWMKQLLAKGNEVLVNGKITYKSYENDKGETKHITEIVVKDFIKLSKKD